MAFTDYDAAFTAQPKRSLTGYASAQLAIVFTVSIFLSATLLFSVQPMFSKMVLPLLGGSSNVWNTAMVFFQSMLLFGYIYAHLISKYFGLRTQIGIHIVVLLIGMSFLPLSIVQDWAAPTSGTPIFWLLALFGFSIGVPFFAISANAPLFQSWFSRTSHEHASDPYFLYAASNAGSLLTLCAYPVFIEPNLILETQTSSWTLGYVALIAMILACGVLAVFYRSKQEEVEASVSSDSAVKESPPLPLKLVLFWVALAFIPSSLMLGVTSYMTNNIASAPFLWIIPLALYLLTFVIVFMKKPIIKYTQLSWIFPTVIVAAICLPMMKQIPHIIAIVLNLTCYFLITLYCHSRLVEARPPATKLTQFYIFMSLGGVLGGIFNALIVPLIFNDIYEYVLVLWLAGVLIACNISPLKKQSRKSLLMACVFFTAAVIGAALVNQFYESPKLFVMIVLTLLTFLGLRELKATPIFIAFNLVAVLSITNITMNADYVYKDRSFYSMIKIRSENKGGNNVHSFTHGDTLHNYQLTDEQYATMPLAYYAEGNTFDQVADAVRSVKPSMTAAVIGLGAGAMACFENPGDDWTYFEIDPAVVKMATDTSLFSYIDRCSVNPDIRIGDARLTIQELPKKSQDVIFVDAFSSDSIPIHLVTRESLAIYREYLKEDGVIFFHTSNRVMDVSSVVGRLAEDIGWGKQFIARYDFEDHPFKEYVYTSTGVIIGPEDVIETLKVDKPYWHDFEPSEHVKVWTDDYSSIIGPIRAKMALE